MLRIKDEYKFIDSLGGYQYKIWREILNILLKQRAFFIKKNNFTNKEFIKHSYNYNKHTLIYVFFIYMHFSLILFPNWFKQHLKTN